LVEFSPAQQLAFGLTDSFTRTEEAPFVVGQGPITRDVNQGSVQARYAPGGGRLQGVLRYTNRLDIFEASGTDLSYADTMGHERLVDVSWRWLPKTALYFSGAVGRIHYLNPPSAMQVMNGVLPAKYDSTPLRLLVGLRGLITEKLTMGIGVGYG